MEIRYVTERIKVDPRETGCDDWKRIELAYDHVHWWAWVLVALNLLVLLPKI